MDHTETPHLHIHRIGSTPGNDVVDTLGEFARRYQADPGDVLLIRPDGYLAARVRAGKEVDVFAHLTTYWGCSADAGLRQNALHETG